MKAIIQRVMRASVTGKFYLRYYRVFKSYISKLRTLNSCAVRRFCFTDAIIKRVHLPFVGDEVVSSIGRGLCVLVGISRYDTTKEMEYIVRKVLNLRIFEHENGKRWDRNVVDLDLEILCISQFTLDVTLKGNKLDFHEAMGPDLSQQFYIRFLEQLKASYKPEKIKDGQFGAYMQVHIQNDGPVTIPLEAVPAIPAPKNKNGKVKEKSKQDQEAAHQE